MALNPSSNTIADSGTYISKAGTEIHAVFNGKKFGDLHMIKYAVQRDVANVHVMGTVDAVSVAKGKRSTTGACVFAVFEKDRLLEAVQDKTVFLTEHELVNYGDGSGPKGFNPLDSKANLAIQAGGTIRDTSAFDSSSADSVFNSFGREVKPMLIDQIPPFDIVLVGISEASGHASRMVIHGVQFNSDQGGSSVDDLLLERQVTFIAKRITPWTALKDLSYGSSSSLNS